MSDERFHFTPQHMKLLQRMYVEWEEGEAGGPAISPKRPYGNSDVAYDVAEILGIPVIERGPGTGMDDDQEVKLMVLHRETEVALQIVLVHLHLAKLPRYSVYRKVSPYDRTSWVLETEVR